MVVSLSNKNRPHIPPPLQGLTRVEEMTVIGVAFTHTLSFAPHILKVTNKAAASLYVLKTVKAHGLQATWSGLMRWHAGNTCCTTALCKCSMVRVHQSG